MSLVFTMDIQVSLPKTSPRMTEGIICHPRMLVESNSLYEHSDPLLNVSKCHSHNDHNNS